jgi:transcriptional regulator with XRE-family HTH domain
MAPKQITPKQLAAAVKAWRERRQYTAEQAAEVLGMPVRTLNGIEQGRGFRYVKMLILAIGA